MSPIRLTITLGSFIKVLLTASALALVVLSVADLSLRLSVLESKPGVMTSDQIHTLVCSVLQNSANVDFLYGEDIDQDRRDFLADSCDVTIAEGTEKRTL